LKNGALILKQSPFILYFFSTSLPGTIISEEDHTFLLFSHREKKDKEEGKRGSNDLFVS
jgi:hypothetical protein